MGDKPNVVIPLAFSYNERGSQGFTTTFTDGLDQRKINCIYGIATNPIAGKTTAYLEKRQGVTVASGDLGTSGQTAYLVSRGAQKTGNAISDMWVFSVNGSDIRASDTSTTTTIVTAAGYAPVYVDFTSVSGAEFLVVQLRNASFAQTVWYSNGIGSFTQITDGDFTSFTVKGKMEFMDGYAFALSAGGRVYNSDLNSLANWTPSNYIAKQIEQDVPRGLARLGNRILAFGDKTVEVFANAGNATGSPLVSLKDQFRRIGLATVVDVVGRTHYYTTVGGRIYFVGTTRSTGLWSFDGSRFEKVSTNSIDKILTNKAGEVITSFAVRGVQGVAIAMDGPSDATQRWLMFFPEWNDWFEFHSTVFRPANDDPFFLGVGSNQHKLYSFIGSETYQDNGTDYTVTVQFKIPSDGNHRKFMSMCGVIGDTARAASNLGVSFSDDDYQTFSTARNIDMTSGQKMITRCGSYRDRVVKLTHTGNTPLRLEKFVATVS